MAKGAIAEVSVADHYDSKLPTCGINEAIAALPREGGRVCIPAGTYVLRQPVRPRSNVSLIGHGPATVLTIETPRVVRIAADLRRGRRVVDLRGATPAGQGEAIGLCDDRHRGWWGTHTVVAKVDGKRLWLADLINRVLKTGRKARAANAFPAIHVLRETDVEIRDLTVKGTSRYKGNPFDFTYSAIHVETCQRVRVLNCTIFDWPSDGFSVQRGSDAQVLHCQAHGCLGHGFHPGTGLGESVWSHNIAKGNRGDGFYFCASVHHSVCSDSVFAENKGHGIGGVGHGNDHHNVVGNNVCSYNGRCGIHAIKGREHLIAGNMLLSNSQEKPGRWPGILINDFQHALVQGNRCADDQKKPTQTRGIVESGESQGNLISGNLCSPA